MRSILLVVLACLGVLGLAACAGQPAAVRTVTAPAASVSSTAPVSSPAAPASAPAVTAPPAVTTPATTPPPAAPTTFPMPNEVGKVLQTAQDDIQAVSGNPLYFTTSSDATGQGRHQILDRDWQVCSQSVAPGTTVNDGDPIDFAVVKTYEACP